jgi:hypothetical protein
LEFAASIDGHALFKSGHRQDAIFRGSQGWFVARESIENAAGGESNRKNKRRSLPPVGMTPLWVT